MDIVLGLDTVLTIVITIDRPNDNNGKRHKSKCGIIQVSRRKNMAYL